MLSRSVVLWWLYSWHIGELRYFYLAIGAKKLGNIFIFSI